MKQVKEIGQMIGLNMVNMLGFELLYRFLTIPLYLKMIDRGLKYALEASGYSYITAGNLVVFFLKPRSLLVFMAVGLAGLFFLSVEIGGLITAYQGAVYLRKVPITEMLAGGLQKTAEECRKRSWKLFLVLAGEYLLSNLLLLCRVLSHVKPVNFVMEELLHTRFGFWGAAAGIGILAFCLISGIYTLYFSMAEQKSFTDSWWNSRCLMKGKGRKVIWFLIVGNLLLLLAAVLCYLLAASISAAVIVLVVKRRLQMAVFMGTVRRLELLFLFLYSMFVCVLNVGMIGAVYYQVQGQRPGQTYGSTSGSFFEAGYRRKLLLAGGLFMCLNGFFIFDLVYNGSQSGSDAFLEIQITAHRGSSKSAPENTIAAVEAAVEEMADFVEIDVQETFDGALVVCHDANLSRLAGVNRSVADMTLEEISQLDVGRRFSEDFAGEGIPELKTVMEHAKGRVNLNIELKKLGKDTDMPEAVAELIQEMGMEEQCVVSSVDLRYLERVKKAAPEIRTGYIIAAAYGNYYTNEALDFISIRSSFVTRELVERAHEAGKGVHVWTVNSTAELEQMRLAGVDNIITDDPITAREICFREEATESLLEYLQMMLR